MKILNSFKLDKKIQKVLETRDGYIINGHYYLKTTMAPKALEAYPSYGDPEDLGTHTRCSIGYNANMTTDSVDSIISDSIDPDISYVFTSNFRTNSLTLLKLNESNSTCRVLATSQYAATFGANSNFVQCIGQDDDFIYCLVEASVTGAQVSCVKFEKSTLNGTLIINHSGYSTGKGIYEDDECIIWVAQRRYGSMNLYKYMKVAGTYSTLTVATSASNQDYCTIASDAFIKSEDVIAYYAIHHTASQMVVKEYSINLVNSTVSVLDTAIIWDDTTDKIPVALTASVSNRYKLFINNVDDNMYLNIINFECGNATSNANNTLNGVYTFLISNDNTNELQFTGKLDGFPVHLRGSVLSANKLFAVLATLNATYMCTFNKVSRKFEIMDILNNQPRAIGIDLQDNVWVINTAYEVDMYSLTIPTKVNILFEKGSYQYQGSDINSYLSIEAYNYNGNNVEVDLELTLRGNAIFSATGNKTCNINTGTNGEKQVPIKVTGPGTLSVYTKVSI